MMILPPSLKPAGKDIGGRLLRRPQRAHPAATLADSLTAVLSERTARKVYRTRDEARADVFVYIERFHNPRRRHPKLGYLSPMEFEARAMLA